MFLVYKLLVRKKLQDFPQHSQEKIKGVTLGNTPLEVSEGVVTIPIATAEAIGVVKSSAAENGVNVNSDGTMTVNNINLSKITQTSGTELILNGGDATVSE